MLAPSIPVDEHARVAALESTDLLDTAADERFDRYTRLIRKLFDVPIALVSLVDRDRQWFKSRQGLDAPETPRDISFCGHAILQDQVFVVEDASNDTRFTDNPLVTADPNIRFYAGAPLTTPDGYRIGTLCIIDREPRELAGSDVQSLHDMAAMVSGELAALRLATVDELTGLSNRRAFNMLAAQVLAVCARNDQAATLVAIDMDGFKQINDSLGHAAGDEALREFATIMREVFRESDLCARLGGDEFAVLMTAALPDEVTAGFARFASAIESRNSRLGQKFELACSYGAVQFDAARHDSIAALMKEADARMYDAKRARKQAAG